MAELWFPPHLLSQFFTMIITDRFFFISPRFYQRSYKQSLRNLTIIDYWSGWSALDFLGLDFFRTMAGHFWTFTGASLSDSSTVLNFDLWTFDLVSSSSGFFFSSWCFHYHQLPPSNHQSCHISDPTPECLCQMESQFSSCPLQQLSCLQSWEH